MDVNIFKSYDNIFNFFLAVNEGIFHMWTFSFNNDNNQGFHMQIQPWDIHMSSTTGLKRQKQLGNHLLTKGRPPTQPGNGRWVTFLSKNVCWSHNKYPLGGLSSRKGLRIPKSFKKKKKKLWKKDEVWVFIPHPCCLWSDPIMCYSHPCAQQRRNHPLWILLLGIDLFYFSPPALRRYTWHMTLCKFKVHNVMFHTLCIVKWWPQ